MFNPNPAFPATAQASGVPGMSAAGGAGYVTPEQWDQYMATIRQAYQASSGFERTKLKAQYDDAEKGRQNSLKIAQLQADNSRYGVDQQRLTEIERLKQADRQFAANHDLDVAKLTGVYNGAPTLDAKAQQMTEAQLIMQQRSQPNRLFQTMDLEQALGSIRNGGRARIMAPTGVAAVDGLSTDYQGNPYLAGGANSGGGARPSPSVPGQVQAQGQGQTQAPDPRLKAARTVMDALPPSATEGLDPTGVAALNAVFSLYHAPLRPGTLETLSPTQQSTLQSGSERVQQYTGRSYDDLMSEYDKNKPRQGSVLAA